MAFLDFLFGKRQKTQHFQTFTPQQNQYLDQLLGGAAQTQPQILNYLQSLLNPSQEAQDQFAAPYLRQFHEEIIPSIAERFTGRFGAGSQQSSAFGQQLGKAGAGLVERLASLRQDQALRALSGLNQQGQVGLTPRFETAIKPGYQGLFQNLLGSTAQALPLLLAL